MAVNRRGSSGTFLVGGTAGACDGAWRHRLRRRDMGKVRNKAARRIAAATMVGIGMAAGVTQAATFTYNREIANTSGAPDLWSAGTNWSAVPVSDGATTLTFSGTLPASATVFTNNDIGSFTLNRLNITYAAAGAAPLLSISGS